VPLRASHNKRTSLVSGAHHGHLHVTVELAAQRSSGLSASTEVLSRCSAPWKGMDDVEYATLEWVDWFNHRRLLEPIGHIPPAEFETAHYQRKMPHHTAGLKQPSALPLVSWSQMTGFSCHGGRLLEL
jgi:hypothetical protein